MKFRSTDLEGVMLIDVEPVTDERGYFARLWCEEEFREQGINIAMVQASVSHNRAVGTLRGLHFQWPPSREGKLVRCERGRVFDVIVDLRPESATFTRHIAVELDSESRNGLYIPPGCAHGFQTLEPDSDVAYMMSDRWQPELAGGFRFNDPAFGIQWPLPVSTIVARDRDYPDFDAGAYCGQYSDALAERGEDR